MCNAAVLLNLLTKPTDERDAVLVMLLQVPLLAEVDVRE